MAPRTKASSSKSGGGIFSCCQPKKKGCAPSMDPDEIVIDQEVKEQLALLPMAKDIIQTNSVVEIQPPKDEASKIVFRPRVDTLYDTVNKSLIIVLAVPGFVRDEVDIEIEQGVLHVSGQCRKSTATEKYGDGLNVFNRELHYGHFYRVFQLPPNVLEETAEASISDGIIQIKLKCVNAGEKRKVALA